MVATVIIGVGPPLRSMLADVVVSRRSPVVESVDVEVDTADLDLDDAALLHRDPSAERSRLVTRGFRAGAVRSWWTGDQLGELVARIILFRFVDANAAALAAADCWSDLHAGGARFVRTPMAVVGVVEELGDDGVNVPTAMVGVVEELGDDRVNVWTALSFVSVDDLVAAVFGCADAHDVAVRLCSETLEAQRHRLMSG